MYFASTIDRFNCYVNSMRGHNEKRIKTNTTTTGIKIDQTADKFAFMPSSASLVVARLPHIRRCLGIIEVGTQEELQTIHTSVLKSVKMDLLTVCISTRFIQRRLSFAFIFVNCMA